MKKLVTILFLMVMLVRPSFAQLKLGLKLSPQLTYVNTESKGISTNGVKLNASYGMMVDYYFTENYAFATEFNIAHYGGKLTVNDVMIERSGVATQQNSTVTYDYSLRYVNIPLLIKMRTKEIGYWRYFAEFGLDNSFLIRNMADLKTPAYTLTEVNLNQPDKADEYTIKSTNPPATTYTDDINFYRAGLLVGIGAQYNVYGNTLLIGGVRYNSAFSNFTKESNWKARMHGIALTVGVLF